MLNTNATACTVSYAFLSGKVLFKFAHYFSALNNRVPRVVEMATTFIRNIVNSNEFNITLSSVYLSGFCLGAHIAGMVGQEMKESYNGRCAAAIWGTFFQILVNDIIF